MPSSVLQGFDKIGRKVSGQTMPDERPGTSEQKTPRQRVAWGTEVGTCWVRYAVLRYRLQVKFWYCRPHLKSTAIWYRSRASLYPEPQLWNMRSDFGQYRSSAVPQTAQNFLLPRQPLGVWIWIPMDGLIRLPYRSVISDSAELGTFGIFVFFQ